MKSIERRFNGLQEERPNCSSLINFNGAVKGQRFSRKRLGHYFAKLVEKGDYSRKGMKEILDYAFALSWLKRSR
ncbi:hypothetical protein A2880_03325 [Candidatus Peribacteria bacterium RIFCSPHIGHO2_01_FULL_49_38]|nr:MAG: hypothetical protein A2880_03325 [Candidatus Peribacteria bacterium RIFCSPHIGHO2_01_FULL_49_38]